MVADGFLNFIGCFKSDIFKPDGSGHVLQFLSLESMMPVKTFVMERAVLPVQIRDT